MEQSKINLQYTVINQPLPDFIYDGLKPFVKSANAYKPQPPELIGKLAKKHGVSPEMVYLTAGIDEAIQMFAKTYGQNAYVFTPAYVVYADVEEFGGKLTRIPSIKGTEFSVSTAKIPGASLIYLANPNNPAGFTPKEKVLELVKNNPQAKVVIDEAYGEFAYLSVISEVEKYPQLSVFRSFSKAYAMAGNRIGYMVAHPEVIREVSKKSQWSNVSYLSVGAASLALDHEEYYATIREDINKRRDEFTAFLKEKGFPIIPSKINAVLFKFPSEEAGTRFAEYLNQNNFIVSHGNGNSNMGLDKSYVRIAIGTTAQMDTLRQVITKYK